MKANELMIGDWVFTRGKIEQVTSIYDGYICTENYEDSHDYYFDPIPLTAEILEKNGFEKSVALNPRRNYWKLSIGSKYFQIFRATINVDMYGYEKDKVFQPTGNYEIQCFNRAVYSNGDITENFAELYADSVHELQHILRICGIEKGIVL